MAAVRGGPCGLPGSVCPGLAHLRTVAALFVIRLLPVEPVFRWLGQGRPLAFGMGELWWLFRRAFCELPTNG